MIYKRSARQLDSIYKMMKKDTIPFSEAAAKFSDDKDTKYNGGLLANPQTGQTRWDMDQLGQNRPYAYIAT